MVTLGAGVAAGVLAEVDPTVQPVRQSFIVFLFLAVALVLLLLSMLRHMRRARASLPPREQAGTGQQAGEGDAGPRPR